MTEMIIASVLAGTATQGPLSQADRSDLQSLTGRWELAAATADGLIRNAWQIALRIDGAAISGDVFQPLEEKHLRRQMRLGGRDDWRFSFWGTVGEAIEDGDGRWLTAICDASHRLMTPTAARPRAVLSLRVARENGGRPRPEIRLALLSDLGGTGALGWVAERKGRAEPEAAPADLTRRVRLIYTIALNREDPGTGRQRTGKELADRRTEILKGLFLHELGPGQSAEWTLEESMRREGVELAVTECDPYKIGAGTRSRDPTPDGLLEDMLVDIALGAASPSSGGAQAGHADPDWTLALVLSGDPRTDEAHGGAQILGRAYGLMGGQNRFRTRFGAILHIAEIEKDISDFNGALPEDEIRRRLVCHSAIHELGHLLNLPHCWERDRGFRTLRDAAPGSPTCTNYASSWPFGQAASASYSEIVDDGARNERRRRQRLRYFSEIGLMRLTRSRGFDEDERAFIRHAPFDHIAQGGRTFLDDSLPAPALMRPSEGRERLEIGCLAGGLFRAVSAIDLWHWRSSDGGSEVCFPPIPALVRFVRNDTPVSVSDDFRFESAALQLLVREERLTEPEPYEPERRTIAFDPSRSLRLLREYGESYEEVVLLPWLTLDDAKGHFEDNPVKFSVQVVYFRNSQQSFASNIVRVSFAARRDHPATPEEFGRLIRAGDVERLRPHAAGAAPRANPLGSGPEDGPGSLEIENPYKGA